MLSVVATASPFIGLFGTVYGIMHAFGDIAAQGNTNLTTVAPAIAEALFATGIGLAAGHSRLHRLQQILHRRGQVRRSAGDLR